MAAIVITGTYCAKLTSHLAVHERKIPFLTLEEAVKQDADFYIDPSAHVRNAFAVGIFGCVAVPITQFTDPCIYTGATKDYSNNTLLIVSLID